MRRMRSEMDEITGGGKASRIESYNNSKEEMAVLNDVLQDAVNYSVTFTGLSRDGDLIRRDFDLLFTVDSYDSMKKVIRGLEESKCRCLVSDINCSQGTRRDLDDNYITVNASATFYETMVGGTEDAGLPPAK